MLGFLCTQLPPWQLSPSWATAVFGLCLEGAKPRLFQPGYIQETAPDMSGEFVISLVLSLHSKDLKWHIRQIGSGQQEMARVNVDILGISELKWTTMGEFNSDDH